MHSLFIPLALLAGVLLALQAGANAQLSKAVGGPFGATVLQLSIGAGLLAAAAAATGSLAALGGLAAIPWWHGAGGVASAFYVVSTILLFPRIGAVVTVGLFIAGQMAASLALDGFGLLGVAPRPIGAAALAGAAAVFVGAGAIVLGQGAATDASRPRAGWVLLALVAGAVLPAQGAVNALLRADIGAPFAVGTVSFLVATGAMALALGLSLAVSAAGRPSLAGLPQMPWWGWLGGFAGATYVTVMFLAMPAIGAAATVGLTVVGQQLASVFVDRYGWFRLPRREVSPARLVGVGLIVAGVAALTILRG